MNQVGGTKMTNERRVSPKSPDIYKQIVYEDIKGPNKYTTSYVTEDDYMNTRVWQKLRGLVLKRDGYRCTECGTGKQLEVHHLSYPDVWGEEPLSELKTVCRECHKKIHLIDNERRENK